MKRMFVYFLFIYVFFFAVPFSKKIANMWNFQWIKYLGKGLSYWKNWGIRVNNCWNYGPSKLLLHFIEYHLDQLISKHTKTAVNSTIQYFEGRSQQKCLLKVWRFLVHPSQNGGPVQFLRNWPKTIFLMATIFKLSRISGFWFNENA